MKKEEIKCMRDFETVRRGYELSLAPIEVKEKAIKELETMYPEYVSVKKTSPERAMEMFQESSADVDDFNFGG